LRLIDEKCYRINKSLKNVLNTTRLPSSDVRRVFPPFIEYTKPENTYLSFQVTFKTEILCKYPVPNWLKRTHDVIMPLHNKGMSVRAISDYLNFHNIKSPHGKDYYPTLVSMTILKLKRRNDRLVNSKLKIKKLILKKY